MKSKKISIFIIVLLVFACITGIIHFSTREMIPDDALKITYHNKEIYVDIHKIEYKEVKGIRVNGKGDKIPVEGQGILIENLLAQEDIKEFSEIEVIADDSYSAKVKKDEMNDDVYLLYEENSVRLIVFKDTNSKRSVSNVVSINVK